MRISLPELLARLGVYRMLQPYTSQPWSVFDADNGMHCSAQVALDGCGNILEVEIQTFTSTPEPGKPEFEQIMAFRCSRLPDGTFEPDRLDLRGEHMLGKWSGISEQACLFTRKTAEFLERDEVPDFDDLIRRIFRADLSGISDNWIGGGGGRGLNVKEAKAEASNLKPSMGKLF